MTKMKCPGLDTRNWKPEDIFDIPCPKCNKMVEFFKDDPCRSCPDCGTRIMNPKIKKGCAEWCRFAEECLGVDPEKK